MKYTNNKQETLNLHTDSARDTQTGALCFMAEEKLIQISELTSFHFKLYPLKQIYLTLTAMLLQLQHCFCEQLYFQKQNI